MDFSVQVLTQGFWPSQKQRDLQLSHEMRDAKSAFNTWYTERHSHRVLSWVYILGDVVVKGAVKSGFPKSGLVPMVWSHDWKQPIGKGVIEDGDDKAVFKVDGKYSI